MSRAAVPLTDPTATAYIAWCEQERVPPNTIRRRRTVLRAVGNPGTATREELEEWWASRGILDTGKPRAETSRANELAVLRSFYRWCQVWEHRTDDPTVRLTPPRPGDSVPKPTTRGELDRVLDYLREHDQPALRRAVLLGAWAGLRRAEAALLRWPDIDPETHHARVTGKGRKTRIVTFSTKLIDELLPDTGGNVVTGTDRTWSPDTLGAKVNAAIKAAGVDGTFHKLRHRYGSIAYQRNKDPIALAKLMGHASAATTMKYYAAAADDAAQAIADSVID